MVSTKVIAGGIAMGAEYALRNWDKIESAIAGIKRVMPADAKFKQQFATLQADIEGMRAELTDKTERLRQAEAALAAHRQGNQMQLIGVACLAFALGVAVPFLL